MNSAPEQEKITVVIILWMFISVSPFYPNMQAKLEAYPESVILRGLHLGRPSFACNDNTRVKVTDIGKHSSLLSYEIN